MGEGVLQGARACFIIFITMSSSEYEPWSSVMWKCLVAKCKCICLRLKRDRQVAMLYNNPKIGKITTTSPKTVLFVGPTLINGHLSF